MNRCFLLDFVAVDEDDDCIYSTSFENKLFFCIDKRSYKVNCLGKTDGLHNDVFRILKVENILFRFYKNSYDVDTFDLQTRKMQYFTFGVDTEVAMQLVCEVNDEIWMFSYKDLEHVIIFSLRDYKYRVCEINVSILNRYVDKCVHAWENEIVIENKIWRCMVGTNAVYCIDVNTSNVSVYEFEDGISLFSISYRDDNFYLTTMDGKYILCWNEQKGLVATINTQYVGDLEKVYRKIVFVDEQGMLLLPSRFNTNILYLKLNENDVKEILEIEYPIDFYDNYKDNVFRYYYRNDEDLYILPGGATEGMLKLELETMTMEFQKLYVDEFECNKAIMEKSELNLVKEKELGLGFFLNFIVNK